MRYVHSVGVRELRQDLSVHLRRVAAGRMTPVRCPSSGARDLPLPAADDPTPSEVLRQMRDEDER